jgi:hypothetical protein
MATLIELMVIMVLVPAVLAWFWVYHRPGWMKARSSRRALVVWRTDDGERKSEGVHEVEVGGQVPWFSWYNGPLCWRIRIWHLALTGWKTATLRAVNGGLQLVYMTSRALKSRYKPDSINWDDEVLAYDDEDMLF